ncbi:hypothetical protein QBC43DRAFT_189921, partial [Cladorrhinum sp. PSN259]
KYEVFGKSHQRIDSLPTIPRGLEYSPDGAALELLRHVSAFEFFRNIENRDPNLAFEESFQLTVTPSPVNRILTLKNDDEWELAVENRGKRPLYVSAFNLRSTWDIVSLLSDGGQGDFWVISPRSENDTDKDEETFEMEVPEIRSAR